ncbi:MAG: DUF1990 domain-containing protein [Acidobacteriota bacterium]|nr:DUF1990 domain-containing protein [Acidobacteriota bacterium]
MVTLALAVGLQIDRGAERRADAGRDRRLHPVAPSVAKVIVAGRRRAEALVAQLERSARDDVTYAEVGGTRWPDLPDGYRHDRVARRVGQGERAWERAKDAIRLWKAQAHVGITLTPARPDLFEGNTVLASRGVGPVSVAAPCRIVYVTDEPSRFGFAYGTLPGHPVRGEEAFHVFADDHEAVWAEITAFSRPDDLPTRLAGPVGRRIQVAAARRYLQGLAQHVDPAGPSP